MTENKPALRVGMIGYAFMGAAHSQAWRTAPRFFDLPLVPEMSVVCGRNAAGVAEAAARLGWANHATSWRSVVEDVLSQMRPRDRRGTARVLHAFAAAAGEVPEAEAWSLGWTTSPRVSPSGGQDEGRE